MIITAKTILNKAQKGKYAVGAFNIYNIETLHAAIDAAENLQSPIIIQTSESAIAYAGLEILIDMMRIAARESKVPIAIHVDHGRDMKLIKKAISIGYTSVMIDASHHPFEENIKLTKEIVKAAKKRNITVESELGIIGGKEDDLEGTSWCTDPKQAVKFVRQTGIDSLAVAIGTSHGAYKVKGDRLRLDILKEIRKRVSIPLVLHGASLVPKHALTKARSLGMQVGKAQGIPKSQIKKAINLGICKINVDTDLRLAFSTALREYTQKHPESINPRDALSYAQKATQRSVEEHLRLFGSVGKA
ncbi:class II fructose-1,6-bisphosphate aldolase [Candidatus Pacearchaeota archaeon]|nr:class II fructose-1,6-bisphosphate aldolase [Candidatus Pacearchaeota archaeon]